MKANTKDNDSLFEQSFAKHPFISEKNVDIRETQQKLLIFNRFTFFLKIC